MACKCKIEFDEKGQFILYCPLHAAAGKLLEAAKAALNWYDPRLSPFEEGPICKQLKAAITKAEPNDPQVQHLHPCPSP